MSEQIPQTIQIDGNHAWCWQRYHLPKPLWWTTLGS